MLTPSSLVKCIEEFLEVKGVKLKGAEILMYCLQREGVDVIFGYPGGAVLPIYDALYDSPIKHILSGMNRELSMLLTAMPGFPVR